MDLLYIILLQFIYVPIFTLRTIFMVKNIVVLSSILGFLEAIIYLYALKIVFSDLSNVYAMIVYAAGFSLGIFIGNALERKLAVGYTVFSVNLMNKNKEMVEFLRTQGYGVTLYKGEGRDSERYKLEILTKRSKENELLFQIEKYEPSAFIIAYEPKTFKGGYLLKVMKKRRIKLKKEKQSEI